MKLGDFFHGLYGALTRGVSLSATDVILVTFDANGEEQQHPHFVVKYNADLNVVFLEAE